ncbi:MAG: lipoprotein [Halopseudomonas sp.]
MLRWTAALLLSLWLTGCGQKGDLYLPPAAEQAETEQPSSAQP